MQYRQRTDRVGVWKELTHDGSVPDHEGATPKLRLTIAGLDNGAEYLVRVAAKNDEGTGPYTATESATPFSRRDLPGTPKNLRVHPSDARLDVRWEAPDHRGDPELTHYLVSIPRTGIPRTVDAPDTATVFKDRVNGRSYQVSVAACKPLGLRPLNPAGDGDAAGGTGAARHRASAVGSQGHDPDAGRRADRGVVARAH